MFGQTGNLLQGKPCGVKWLYTVTCTEQELINLPIEKKESCLKEYQTTEFIKLNQVGIITETLESIEMAYLQFRTTVLCRTGSSCRGERVEKFNQLMRIEHCCSLF
jgi:enolase